MHDVPCHLGEHLRHSRVINVSSSSACSQHVKHFTSADCLCGIHIMKSAIQNDQTPCASVLFPFMCMCSGLEAYGRHSFKTVFGVRPGRTACGAKAEA